MVALPGSGAASQLPDGGDPLLSYISPAAALNVTVVPTAHWTNASGVARAIA
jgi:hypothetical protein